MEERTLIRFSELERLSGYLIAGGALVGFSVGIWRVFNNAFFSFFVEIAEFEAVNYFLAVFMPSFVVLVIVGYLFTTTIGLKELKLSNATTLCIMSLISIVLSALSIFYFISLIGGIFSLVALLRAYTKPSFRHLSIDLAFFFVEIGSMLMAVFSILFLLVWVISNFFVTYAVGFLGSYSPAALFVVAVLSFVLFFTVPSWGSRGTNSGMSSLIGFSLSVLWYLFIIQNQYVLFGMSAYVGMTFLIAGFGLVLTGSIMFLTLFFSEPIAPAIPSTSILLEGEYCPNCGSRRVTAVQKQCSRCGRSLMWTPQAPYCSACGKLVPTNVLECPHCFGNIGNKRNQFELITAQDQTSLQTWNLKREEKPSWLTSSLMRAFSGAKFIFKPILILSRLLRAAINRTNLGLKDAVIVMILTYVFGFISFISYVRVDTQTVARGSIAIVSYGFPANWLHVWMFSYPWLHKMDVEVVPAWLILDVILYFTAAFLIVYGIQRLRR